MNGQAYTWDNNGNLLNDGTTQYAYDQANRLISVTVGVTTTQFAYNGDGARLKQVVNAAVTTYTLDLAAPLVQVLVAKDSSGDTRYLYGVTRIGEQQSAGWVYHLSDALGSVRQLADGSGEVTLARGYTPYGEPLWSEGTGQSAYGFTGEAVDVSIGLVFLRARYMQPTLGIFLARDPWSGDAMSPGSMNGFNYTEGNPVNRVDPSGNFICFAGPPGFLICLVAGAVVLLAGGCNASTDSCPALPANLQPGPFGNMSRAEALIEVQKLHNIQLPPGFQFEYDPSTPLGETGFAHWFDDPKFGEISIYETAFTAYAANPYGATSSAYDVEAIMVHEAVHAWQIASIMKLAADDKSNFKRSNTGNPYQPSYTEVAWYGKYKKVFEWEAWTYVENHEPPLCPSQAQKKNIADLKRDYYQPPYPLIDGLPTTDRIPLVGYPLP